MGDGDSMGCWDVGWCVFVMESMRQIWHVREPIWYRACGVWCIGYGMEHPPLSADAPLHPPPTPSCLVWTPLNTGRMKWRMDPASCIPHPASCILSPTHQPIDTPSHSSPTSIFGIPIEGSVHENRTLNALEQF